MPSDVGDNDNVQMTTITKSKSVSFSFLSRPTYPVLLLIFYLQQEIKLEWHNGSQGMTNGCPGLIEKIGIHQKKTGCALITFLQVCFRTGL